MVLDYKTKNDMDWDRFQTKLTVSGCKPNTAEYALAVRTLSFYDLVTCPFCLNYNRLGDFRKVKGLWHCPICGNEMLRTSLIVNLETDIDIANFAKWVYDYRVNGFWKKIYPTFEDWCKKLKELGISYEFWENYKRFRGDNIDEDENTDESEYWEKYEKGELK